MSSGSVTPLRSSLTLSSLTALKLAHPLLGRSLTGKSQAAAVRAPRGEGATPARRSREWLGSLNSWRRSLSNCLFNGPCQALQGVGAESSADH